MAKKPSWYYEQSAVVPFRRTDKGLEVLLITSISGKRWIVPKGIVEPDLSPAESAAKEALEEAGVLGVVGEEPIGQYEYDKWGGTCVVEVFPMEVQEVLDEWEEADARDRNWVSLEEAVTRVSDDGLCELLRDFDPGS